MEVGKMKPEEAVEILTGIPLFEGLGRRDLRRIARSARQAKYDTDEVIIHAGEIDDRLYVVLSGEVKVVKDYMGTKEMALGFVGRGQFFGEMALLDNYVRSATVVANLATECMELGHLDFMELLQSHPKLAVHILPILARRIRKVQSLL